MTTQIRRIWRKPDLPSSETVGNIILEQLHAKSCTLTPPGLRIYMGLGHEFIKRQALMPAGLLCAPDRDDQRSSVREAVKFE